MKETIQTRFQREITATIVLSVILAFAAFAVPAAGAGVVLQAQSMGPVDYVSGGVGKDEADLLKQASADYPLTLEFASSGPLPTDQGNAGYYIAGASVDIRDATGRSVLTTTTDGPFLLARLPDGVYTIETSWNGIHKQATVDIAGTKRNHIVFDYARGAQ